MNTLVFTGESGNIRQAVLHHLPDNMLVLASSIIAPPRPPNALRKCAEQDVLLREADFKKPSGVS